MRRIIGRCCMARIFDVIPVCAGMTYGTFLEPCNNAATARSAAI
ncbi:hypothetical protein [Rickettsia endosymbiont of Aspidapion aeneum]